MLDGYDIDWIPTRNGSVVYSSLAPGDYTFKVRASLNNDFSDAAIVQYRFVIRKPIWATYWFIAIALISAGSVVYLVVRARESRLRREESLQKEKLLFQLQTLKNQVNPHFLFNSFSTLSAIIDEDKEMALDYVQKLSAFFRNILEYRDKSVITLREELVLADTYYYLQKKRYGANFNLVTNIPEDYLHTFIPPMTLQMIIENAVKHNVISTDKPLTVAVHAAGDSIVITNVLQPKKSEATSTGVGLQNIINRYRLLVDREITISRENGLFTVSLPVIKSISS
jgi:LytS/YehU family sensor histidine kinase